MEESNQDGLKRVFVQLTSLRDNLPDTHPNNNAQWDEVNLYNELLDKLSTLNIDVEEFRIAPELLVEDMVQVSYNPVEYSPSGQPKVRYGLFKTKLDALISYFSISEPETKIGFRTNT